MFLYLLSSVVFVLVFFTIFNSNIVNSILSLIGIFILTGVLLIILGLEYMGFLFFSIYAGAISIIFLFVIMLLDVRVVQLQSKFLQYFPMFFFIGFFFFMEIFYFFFTIFTFDFLEISIFYDNFYFFSNLENVDTTFLFLV